MEKDSDSTRTDLMRSGLTLGSMAERIKAKTQQDAQAIEAQTQHAQQQLGHALQTLSQSALSTTQHVMDQQNTRLSDLLQQMDTILETARTTQQEQADALTTVLSGPQTSAQALVQQTSTLYQQAQAEAKTIRQTARLYAQAQRQTARTLLAAVVVSCLLVLGLTWGGIVWLMPWEMMTARDGTPWQVLKGTWKMCPGNRPCRPSGSD